MKLRNLALATAAATFVAAPVVGQNSLERTTGLVEGENVEGENGIITAVFAIAAMIADIIIIADDDDPTSP